MERRQEHQQPQEHKPQLRLVEDTSAKIINFPKIESPLANIDDDPFDPERYIDRVYRETGYNIINAKSFVSRLKSPAQLALEARRRVR